jgi:hypothetical protein
MSRAAEMSFTGESLSAAAALAWAGLACSTSREANAPRDRARAPARVVFESIRPEWTELKRNRVERRDRDCVVVLECRKQQPFPVAVFEDLQRV